MVKLKPGVNFDTNSCICNETTKDGSFMIKCTQKSCLCPWWHTECAGLKGVTSTTMKKCTWICPKCTIDNLQNKFKVDDCELQQFSLDQLQTEVKKGIIDSIPEITQALYHEIMPSKQNTKISFADIVKEQSIPNVPLTKNIIKEALTENNKEQKNLEERKKNIIIFNVPEPSTITHEKLKISDQNLIKELCNYVDESILEDENEITKIQRFGRKKENVNQPIRIRVNTEKAKKKLFRKLYKLKNNEKFKHIRINHDMTENERNLTKQRIEEARQKNY